MPQFVEFLTNNGISENAVLWMLMLPIAITIVTVARQVIGIKGIGITAPVLIGFAFGAIGIQAGAIIFLAAIAMTFVTRSIVSNIRLHSLPKIALILLAVTLAILFLIPAVAPKEQGDLPGTIFAFIILVLSMEQFVALLMERGPRKTLLVALETLLVASFVFFAIHSLWLKSFVLSYPMIVLAAAVLMNAVLGKWTGLRITEYIRFRDLIFK